MSGFGPVRAGSWLLIELTLAALIIGAALTVMGSQYRIALFKATFSEAFVFLSRGRHEIVEWISLTGTWDAGAAAARAEPVQVDPAQSLADAERSLAQSGATLVDGTERTRLLRLDSNVVILVRYPEWPQTGAVAFRPAMPDVAHPVTMTVHCGLGDAPKGWVAAKASVSTNLPASHLPWMCRTPRGTG
jgi:hypothetical protein